MDCWRFVYIGMGTETCFGHRSGVLDLCLVFCIAWRLFFFLFAPLEFQGLFV